MTFPKARALGLILGVAVLAGGCSSGSSSSGASSTDLSQKPASQFTIDANQKYQAVVDAFNPDDFEAAQKNLIATIPGGVIKDKEGNVVWDSSNYDFIQGDAPNTVNPSLWRNALLNNNPGLYKVADGIYEFRGYDIANVVLIQGKTGWIVVDSTLTAAVAQAGLELAQKTLNDDRPVVAVIYTHSHSDHWGGIRGLVDEADVKSGKVKIYAPEDFMQFAVSENVLAGTAMSRRGQYQFGHGLPAGPEARVSTGLGLGLSQGSPGLIPPTDDITRTGQKANIDGVPVEFQLAQGTEAPASLMLYLPEAKALCVGEVINQLMHNVLAIRGAEVRDALVWSKVINESLDLFPNTQVAFGTHFWPVRGREKVVEWLQTQRDTYRFIHDQAVQLANEGESMPEIANETFFPAELAKTASSRGYYGTLSHNMRAVYQKYLGFYDANPATLDPLPRTEEAKKYVDAMGGIDNVIEMGQKAFDQGDYKWVVTLVNNAVFADPSNEQARALQADALEQLGYQSESATWRNAYLLGAQELRDGVAEDIPSTANPDTMRGMSNELLFDFLAMMIDHEKVDGITASAQINFTDSDTTWALELSNSVLNSTQGRVLDDPDVTLTLTRQEFLAITLGGQDVTELVKAGKVKVEGDPAGLAPMMGSMVKFNPQFNLVTPVVPAEATEPGEPLDGMTGMTSDG